MLDLQTVGGDDSRAYGINDTGVVVGKSFTDDGWHRASMWQNGQMADLGTLGGYYSRAHSINNNNWVVGTAQAVYDAPAQTFLWRDGHMENLGNLWGLLGVSTARSVNDAGQVVGESSTATGWYHALFWQDGSMYDLGTLGGLYSAAYGINESGWIVGTATDTSGNTHAVLRQPVPEPSSVFALLCGIGGLGSLMLRRKLA